jgi:hypothetical protein
MREAGWVNKLRKSKGIEGKQNILSTGVTHFLKAFYSQERNESGCIITYNFTELFFWEKL